MSFGYLFGSPSASPLPLPSPSLLRSRQAIAYHLGELLSQLEPVRDNGLPPALDGDPSWWEDEGYVYLEVNTLAGRYLELDLNVCDGKALIRIAR